MKTQKSRVSRISIGRVYNLGNYEHVRYEVTVEVPEGQSASKAIVGLEKIIAGLAPLRCIKTEAELKRSAANIERMEKLTTEEWNREHQFSVGSRSEIIARHKKDHAADILRTARAKRKAARARALFDDLNGSATWKDAKLDWHQDDE